MRQRKRKSVLLQVGRRLEKPFGDHTPEMFLTKDERPPSVNPPVINNVPLYTYKPLSDTTQTRLLILLRGKYDDPLRCRIRSVSLTRKPGFEALSYVWHQPLQRSASDEMNSAIVERSHNIIVETAKGGPDFSQRRLDVTENLYCALRRLRQSRYERTLWVDQLCINQEDLSERSHQVQLMAQIYSSARLVLIWLGEAENNSNAAMQFIPVLAATLRTLEPCNDFDLGRLREFGLPGWDDKVWDSVAHVFVRAWFRRFWVIQETVLARNAVVLCGNMQIQWAVLEQVMTKGANVGNLPGIIAGRSPTVQEPEVTAVYQARFVSSFRNEWRLNVQNWANGALLSTLLAGSRYFEAKDPRDKIYALYGILPPDIKAILTAPDYKVPVIELYREVALVLLQSGHLHMALSQGGVSSQRLFLPSWVPDWSIGVEHETFVNMNLESLGRQAQSGITSLIPLYEASGTSRGRFVYSPSQNFLTVAGKLVGKIKEAMEELQHKKSQELLTSQDFVFRMQGITVEQTTALKACYEMASQSSFHNLDDFLQTMVAGRTSSNQRADKQELRTSFGLTQRWVELCEAGEQDQANTLWLATRPFMGVFGMIRRKRILFRTKEGHLGFGPTDTRPGDQVAVILGCAAPFIVRETADGFILVGECYVQGLMHGEATTRDDLPVQDLKLV